MRRPGNLGRRSGLFEQGSKPAAAAILAILLGISAGPLAAQDPERLNGVLTLVWGDPRRDDPGGGELPAVLDTTLTDDRGVSHRLDLTGESATESVEGLGGLLALNGQRLEVDLAPASARVLSGPPARGRSVSGVRLAPSTGAARTGPEAVARAAPATRMVTGSKPWLSILCKFSDVATEPENLAFFQNMYANVPGGLDHYWRESSYGQIDVAGSQAVDWVDLPQPQAYYAPTPGSGTDADLTSLFTDCTAAADAAGVDFSNGGTGGYEGINMMFNAVLDCCAWGGGRYATLDGVTKVWRVTWEPPWGYADEGVIAHEMGHGFGLPHSNNWDADGYPYDSPWDVMSSSVGYAVNDPTYGRLGKHTIVYHKDMLGWIAPAERFEPAIDGVYTLTLDPLSLATTPNYRMAKISIPASSRFYVVEVRKRQGGYDGNLPGDAVLVFEVDPGREEPAWLYDEDMPAADYSDNEGSMLKVGELFEDAANEISVSVDAATTNGFQITLSVGPPPVLAVTPAAVDFGTLGVGEAANQVLTLANNTTGTAALDIYSMLLSNATDFSLDPNGGPDPCASAAPTLAAGDSCTVRVTFSPGTEATFAEQLDLNTNGDPASVSVPLAGRGSSCAAPDVVAVPDGSENGNPVMIAACVSLSAAAYEVESPGFVTFQAPSITLDNGFTVSAGAEFVCANP